MKRILFLLFVLYSPFIVSSVAAAESQTWKLRPGDTLDIVATTLDIPTEELRRHNPGVLENSLRVGQRLNLPLRSYVEGRALEAELARKVEQIGSLASKNGELEKRIANAESRLRWHPVWFWGFWICFGVIAFIFSLAYWIFRQAHPQVFEQPHERSIGDLRASQLRVRSTFPYDENGVSSRAAGGSHH
jgi:hypothetical protein